MALCTGLCTEALGADSWGSLLACSLCRPLLRTVLVAAPCLDFVTRHPATRPRPPTCRLVDEIVWVKMTVNRRLAKSHGFYLQHAKEVRGCFASPCASPCCTVQVTPRCPLAVAPRCSPLLGQGAWT